MRFESWTYFPKQGVLVDSPRLVRVTVRHGFWIFANIREYVGRNRTWYVYTDENQFWPAASKRMSKKLTRYFTDTVLKEGYTP